MLCCTLVRPFDLFFLFLRGHNVDTRSTIEKLICNYSLSPPLQSGEPRVGKEYQAYVHCGIVLDLLERMFGVANVYLEDEASVALAQVCSHLIHSCTYMPYIFCF